MRVTVGLERLSTCPHAFELQSSIDAPAQERASGAAYLGSCVHRALEAFFLAKREGNPANLNTALDAFTEAWESGQALPSGFTLEQVQWTQRGFETHDADKTFNDGLVLVARYIEEYGEKIEPILIEQSFKIDVDGDEVTGTIDNVSLLAGRQGRILIDFKTGSRAKTSIDAHTSIQLSVYAWALRKIGVWTPEDEIVEFHCLNRYKPVWSNGKPSPKPYAINIIQSRRNLLNYEWIDEVFIPRMIAQKRSGAYPANPGQHCFQCPVRQLCGHWESIQQAFDDIDLAKRESEEDDGQDT
jgi:hypothetical protein